MHISLIRLFVILCLFLGTVDFWFAGKAFHQQEEYGRWLGFASAPAGIVTLSYMCSVYTLNYTLVSAASSVYFAGIDWMLIALIHFVCSFTEIISGQTVKRILLVVRSAALLDSAVMAFNVHREIAVHYVPGYPGGAPYVYMMKPLYIVHLLFTYILVLAIVIFLARKYLRTPRQYRVPYLQIILAIILIVLINAAFLYAKKGTFLTLFDFSIIGYTAGFCFVYWTAFVYRKNEMMKSLAMMIFENIDQGIVLFDYAKKLIMKNKRASELLPDADFTSRTGILNFLQSIGIPSEPIRGDVHSIQFDRLGSTGALLRCDYRRLRDRKGLTVGTLLVFTDATNIVDLLTGFRHSSEFRRYVGNHPELYDHPLTAVVFDIGGLREVNSTLGREAGDRRIRNLAGLMRRELPNECDFIRGYEANLIAICHNYTEEEIRERAERIASSGNETVFFGIAYSDGGSPDTSSGMEERDGEHVMRAIETAVRSIRVKKLLDESSYRSHTLTSLLRALRESDVDTEEHVRRTRRMSTALAEKIGLSDSETANLSLLCLLHDIGKLAIPLEILRKPGPLTPQEWKTLHSHVEKGYQIAMSTEEFRPIAEMILHHHECWDGSGYPEKLTGNSIPLLSRMIAIVDAYDAMVNDRAYRNGMEPERAMEELKKQAGKQFDPQLTEAFLEVLRDDPGIAEGEQTGNTEIRVYEELPAPSPEEGNTRGIPYSRYILDLDERIIEADAAFEAVTGYSREEAIGRMTQFDLIPPEELEAYTAKVAECFRRGTVAYLKHEIVRKDGTRIWVVCWGKRYFDSAEMAFRSEIFLYRSAGPEF